METKSFELLLAEVLPHLTEYQARVLMMHISTRLVGDGFPIDAHTLRQWGLVSDMEGKKAAKNV